MAKFISTLTTESLIIEHALSAFDLERFEQVNVTTEAWGVMVEILTGERKGFYDYDATENSFITA